MRQQRTGLIGKLILAGIALPVIGAMVAGSGCSANSNSKTVEKVAGGTSAVEKRAAASAGAGPGIDLNCIYEHLQKPPESFHYVYKKEPSSGSPVDQEADATPETIDGFRKQPDGTPQPLHAVRADAQSWQAAMAGLTGIAGMSSTIALIRNSAMKRETDGGPLNGYETIHYSIDTARWDATERQILGSTQGPGGFEKGDAWVTAEGCPVKLVLDSEMHKNDGSLLDKIHYEEAMIKK
ncbi:MAG TPA: hypothetical protein VGF16_17615 [Bryobacteraceae bacterium]|jgi:hypothetical protein